jgi:hypothetical protein
MPTARQEEWGTGATARQEEWGTGANQLQWGTGALGQEQQKCNGAVAMGQRRLIDRSIVCVCVCVCVCVEEAGAPTQSSFNPCVLFKKVSECQMEV